MEELDTEIAEDGHIATEELHRGLALAPLELLGEEHGASALVDRKVRIWGIGWVRWGLTHGKAGVHMRRKGEGGHDFEHSPRGPKTSESNLTAIPHIAHMIISTTAQVRKSGTRGWGDTAAARSLEGGNGSEAHLVEEELARDLGHALLRYLVHVAHIAQLAR